MASFVQDSTLLARWAITNRSGQTVTTPARLLDTQAACFGKAENCWGLTVVLLLMHTHAAHTIVSGGVQRSWQLRSPALFAMSSAPAITLHLVCDIFDTINYP